MKIIAIPLLILLITYSQAQQYTNNDIVNLLMDGFFQQLGLPDPKSSQLQCIDSVAAKKIVLFLNQILPRISRLFPPIQQIKTQVQDFLSSFDGAVGGCLGGQADMGDLGPTLGLTSIDELKHKIQVYYVKHEPRMHRAFVQSNNDWQNKRYKNMGIYWADFIREIIKSKSIMKQ